MRKIIIHFISLLLAGTTFAATNATVMVDNKTFLITYPTNFFSINGVSDTNSMTNALIRISSLETNLTLSTNNIEAQITVITNHNTVVSNMVAILTTNSATILQGVAGTNAQARVAVIEAAQAYTNGVPYTNGNAYITGSYYGNGSHLTGITVTVTGSVSGVTIGSSNMIGTVTLTGTGVETAGDGTGKIWRVDYMERTLAPVAVNYEIVWGMPRDEPITLLKVWGKPDAFNATIQVISQGSNDAWRTYETNTAPIMCFSTGTWDSNFVNATIGAGTNLGIRIVDVDTRATNLTIGIKYKY